MVILRYANSFSGGDVYTRCGDGLVFDLPILEVSSLGSEEEKSWQMVCLYALQTEVKMV